MSNRVDRQPWEKVYGRRGSEPRHSELHDERLITGLRVNGQTPLVADGDAAIGPIVLVRCPVCRSVIAQVWWNDPRQRGLEPFYTVIGQAVVDRTSKPITVRRYERLLVEHDLPLIPECPRHGARHVDVGALIARARKLPKIEGRSSMNFTAN